MRMWINKAATALAPIDLRRNVNEIVFTVGAGWYVHWNVSIVLLIVLRTNSGFEIPSLVNLMSTARDSSSRIVILNTVST